MVDIFRDTARGKAAMNTRGVRGGGVPLLKRLLALFGCGPSREQRAIEAYRQGFAHMMQGESDSAIADFAKARQLGFEPE
jgi:hypothetical protein